MTATTEASLGTPSTGVVVTGGASGIGRACALALAAVGRPVAVWDVATDGATQTAEECSDGFGVAAYATAVDVRDRAAIDAAVGPTVEALGTVGGLVHAAGIVRHALEGPFDADTWDDVLAVNLRAEGHIVDALLPSFRAAGAGSSIVGISSIEGLIGHGFVPSYTASKHGLIGLTRAFAHRLGSEGIRVNAVCPGYIDTPMLAAATGGIRDGFERKAPLGRLGAPEDIARAVRFLLSEEASFITGAAIVVDGGVTAVGGQGSFD